MPACPVNKCAGLAHIPGVIAAAGASFPTTWTAGHDELAGYKRCDPCPNERRGLRFLTEYLQYARYIDNLHSRKKPSSAKRNFFALSSVFSYLTAVLQPVN